MDVLQNAVQSIQGINRNIPFSQQKVTVRAKKMFWKDRLKEVKGIFVNKERMEARKRKASIEDEDSNYTIQQIKDKIKEAEIQQKQLLQEGYEIREKEILDYHYYELDDKTEKDRKKKNKIKRSIIKSQQRLHTFYFLTKHAGKGVKGCLKKLIVYDEQGNEQTILDRKSIEDHIINYNKQFFTEPTNTKVYNDKIYDKLSQIDIRDKVVNGNIRKNECDSKEMYEFLKILRKPNEGLEKRPDKISEGMFVKAVKASKKQSASSIFSRRTYAVYKCAILHKKMLAILLLFYNMILAQRYCLNRWLKVLEICMEKGKGPRIRHLRKL